MAEVTNLLLEGMVLMLAVLGFADLVECLVRALLAVPESGGSEGNLVIRLKNASTAEMQLRSVLSEIAWGNYTGRVEVLAEDEESFLIAGKILRKYPNIGLFYQGDLNYNM